jgi:glucose/arabinose dehydrogenase/PKD repeat protein
MKKLAVRPAFVLVTALLAAAPVFAQTVPSGFTNSLVTSVSAPTDLAFLPDGRMLITTQGGALRVYCPSNALPGCSSVPAAGGLLTTPAITLSPICTSSEQGLLGVAVDPSFITNSYVFLFYTTNAAGCRNRVSRFVYNGASNTVGSEQVLIDNMPAPNGNHNAGDLEFGKDDYLYVTIGEGGVSSAARQEHVLTGKVLRITRDGGIPAANPWASTGDRCNVTGSTTAGRRCQETYAWGFRNPFRFAFDPNATGTRFFVNDVGAGSWEEIDEIMPGADYGWNCREGRHATGSCTSLPSMVDPIFEYGRAAGAGVPIASCAAITGGAFVPAGVWPPAYDNLYLFADYTCGGVFQMTASSPYPAQATTFGSGFGGVTNLRFGPFQGTQALYYTTYSGSGQVRRIIHNFPRAMLSANPTLGPIGTTVSFNGSGSSDPNGLVLTYLWDFDGNGTTDSTTATATTSFQYNTPGTYNAALRVRNSNNQTSDPAVVTIEIGGPPTVTIHTPAAGELYRVGQVVTLRGSAVDNTGTALPVANLVWTVLLHHDTHTHPFVLATVGTACPAPNQAQSCLNLTTPAPEDLAAAANSYLEVQLRGTDANNLSRTASRDFQPRKVTLSFTTEPPGQTLRLNGVDVTAPYSATSWEAYVVNAQVNPQPQPNGQTYVFSAWADGPTSNPRAITTPAAAASYTARFRDDGLNRRRFHTLNPCRVIDTRGTAGVPIGGPALAGGSTRTFVLTGRCGIPAGTRAVAANLTVTQPTQAGDLRLFPAGGGATSSSINFRAGQTRANNAVVSLDASGQLSVTCAMAGTSSTHFLLDVVGYFQ